MERQILKFYADWCGPCHAMTPVVTAVSEEYDIPVRAVDIDTEFDMADKYGVASIPTVVLLEDGQEVARHTGSAPRTKVAASLGLS